MTRFDKRNDPRRGRRGGWQVADVPPADGAAEWFNGRLPGDWFDAVDVTVDREEITVVGTLAEAVTEGATEGAAAEGRISRFREDTKSRRIAIAPDMRRQNRLVPLVNFIADRLAG